MQFRAWSLYLLVLYLQLHTAFSREEPGKKVYVTHLLREQGENIWRILGVENGHLYVCG